MTKRVREILSWYDSENAGVRSNLARMLNQGKLGGTGKFVILPVDQGFEHGPARSFAPNPPAYDPRYHFELALEAGCNAYAAPLGFIEAAVTDFAGEIPLILKLNNHDLLYDEKDPAPSVTGSVRDALQLGCAAVGFTIYPGSSQSKTMYQELRRIAEDAKEHGLAVVVWAYPRGSSISKAGETAIDVVAYAAQIAAQLGANIIKVKPPTENIEQPEAKKAYDAAKVPLGTLADQDSPRRAGRVRRPADRDLLGRRQGIGRAASNYCARNPRRRRLRLDYRPQLIPAPQGGCAEAAQSGDRHLQELTPIALLSAGARSTRPLFDPVPRKRRSINAKFLPVICDGLLRRQAAAKRLVRKARIGCTSRYRLSSFRSSRRPFERKSHVRRESL